MTSNLVPRVSRLSFRVPGEGKKRGRGIEIVTHLQITGLRDTNVVLRFPRNNEADEIRDYGLKIDGEPFVQL